MATAALSLSSTARVAPAAPSRSKRSVARPVRARAVATKAEGEISGLSEDGQWQEPVSYTHLTLPTICSV